PAKPSPQTSAKAATGGTTAEGAKAEATAGLATYDDFTKLDLRVGIVVAAARVTGKDKLLQLAVDVGEPEPRPIVAGLALSFRAEDLLGKRVIVIANLEPRKFGKDLVSHGILLATGPSESLTLVSVSDAAPAGAKVK
ncbi:MAG TPA: methionine--tRNA ligase, partial [Polyangiaceae bacterium]